MKLNKAEKLLIIIVLTIVILIAIIVAIMAYMVKNGEDIPIFNKKNNTIDNSTESNSNTSQNIIGTQDNAAEVPSNYIENIGDTWKELNKISQEDIKLEQDNSLYTYFLMKQCLERYYKAENYETVMDLLDEEAKEKLNITYDNIANLYDTYIGADFCIDKIYKQRTNPEDSSQNLYVVYHRIGKGTSKKDIVAFVKNEERTVSFSIYPYEYLQRNNYLNLSENDIVTVNKNELIQNNNNNYKSNSISLSDWSCTKEFYNRYKFDVKYDLEGLYNKLNEEYKNIKFKDYDSFVQYINSTKEKVLNQEVSKYGITKNGNYTEYIALCGEDDYYVFYAKNIMTYVVSLDNYTATNLQYLKVYSDNLPDKQAKYCINRVMKAINNKNYEFVYSKLNPVQKANYYSNFEDFKKFIENGFYNKNNYEVEDGKIMITKNIYQYTVKVTNAEEPDSKNYKKFVMAVTLKGDMDFSISITK